VLKNCGSCLKSKEGIGVCMQSCAFMRDIHFYTLYYELNLCLFRQFHYFA